MPVEVNENTVRVRVAQPSDFEPGSFRTIDIDTARGIKAVIGRRRGETATSTQTFLFDRAKGWDAAKATAWVKEHGKVPMATERFAEIRGVEIFEAGVHKGEKFTVEDIDRMVRNFEALRDKGIKPPLKLGHDDNQQFLQQRDGQPALGWVARLKRAGTKLVADFADVPRALVNLIAKRRYARISSEIYRDFQGMGRALAAVGLLGADIPVVKTLEDLDRALASEAVVIPDDAANGDGRSGEAELIEMAVGTIEGVAINDLPDSSFAFIEPGGTKDSEGKTVPRRLRHFPILGPTGTPDAAHVRAALSRLPQSPFGSRARAKVMAAAAKLGIGEAGNRMAAAVKLMECVRALHGERCEDAWCELRAPAEVVICARMVDGTVARHATMDIEGDLVLLANTEGTNRDDGGDGMDHKDSEKAVVELKSKLAEAERKAKAAEAAQADAEKLKAELAEAKKQAEEAVKLAEEAMKAKAASDAAMRAQEITAFIDRAARDGHLRKRDRELATALMLRLSDKPEKVTFKEADGKDVVRETSPRKLFEEFVESLKLIDFSEQAAAGGEASVDEAHEVANDRAQKMLRAKGWGPEKYGEALSLVFADDPDLQRAYEREHRGGA